MDKSNPPTGSSQNDKSKYLVLDRRQPISSANLFQAGDEVMISHAGEHYRLRRTRNGKLILTK